MRHEAAPSILMPVDIDRLSGNELLQAWDICNGVMERNYLADRGYHTPQIDKFKEGWLWDSVFHAKGLLAIAEYLGLHGNLDGQQLFVKMAMSEVESIARPQWRDGFIGNTRFGEVIHLGQRAPDAKKWGSVRNLHSHAGRPTSGITQPPLFAQGLLEVGLAMPEQQQREFWNRNIGKAVAYHEWHYAHRVLKDKDGKHDGLPFYVHMWETGRDNAEPFVELAMKALWNRLDRMKFDNPATKAVIHAMRDDLPWVDIGERSSDTAAVYQTLAAFVLRRLNYDSNRIKNEYPYLFNDPLAISFFSQGNKAIRDMAAAINQPLPPELVDNMKRTDENLEQLWNPVTGMYHVRDARTKEFAKSSSIEAIGPLISAAKLPDGRELQLLNMLTDKTKYNAPHGLPSASMDSPGYSGFEYWRGAAWAPLEEAFAGAVARRGHEDIARGIQARAVGSMLLSMLGFGESPSEYRSATTGIQLGLPYFSWGAASWMAMAARLGILGRIPRPRRWFRTHSKPYTTSTPV